MRRNGEMLAHDQPVVKSRIHETAAVSVSAAPGTFLSSYALTNGTAKVKEAYQAKGLCMTIDIFQPRHVSFHYSFELMRAGKAFELMRTDKARLPAPQTPSPVPSCPLPPMYKESTIFRF
ncbi:hypothetical protein Hypma_008657 [Hypsizygus marmoreus]|uniref:Uncharacterized protein n=1 Tax=Hypsizygus marmoreus TaxID=39966 RepID=A0A369JQU8_HYPMA|nr:hypothetical protein Hypma_008657 [Hypsizygus marmoreus]